MGVANKSFTLLIEKRSGKPEVEEIYEVEEYVVGIRYFYVRSRAAPYTLSYSRDVIASVKRRFGPEKPWHKVPLRRASDRIHDHT